MHDHTRSNKGDTLLIDETTREEVEGISLLLSRRRVLDNNGVAGIVPACATSTNVGIGS